MVKRTIKKELHRELKPLVPQGVFLEHLGKTYFNLASNDYLGLSSWLDGQQDFMRSLLEEKSFLMSALSSRLLTGNVPAYALLENEIAREYGSETCLVFNSGYHANIGILPALTTKNDLILADKLVHASLIDGMKLSPCKWLRFRHNDLDDLLRLLEKERNRHENIFIVTESVFSMEGDLADLARLVEIKNKYDAFLYVDEAHALGVRGNRGLGLAEELGLLSRIDLLVGTFGKALASQGAFVVCAKMIHELLVNAARSLIFTTGMPPINLLWTRFLWRKMIGMPAERASLQSKVRQFRNRLAARKLLGDSHIVPMLFDNNEACLRCSEKLREAGLWVPAIRHPTVPLHRPRLRFSLSAAFTEDQMKEIHEIVLAHTAEP